MTGTKPVGTLENITFPLATKSSPKLPENLLFVRVILIMVSDPPTLATFSKKTDAKYVRIGGSVKSTTRSFLDALVTPAAAPLEKALSKKLTVRFEISSPSA